MTTTLPAGIDPHIAKTVARELAAMLVPVDPDFRSKYVTLQDTVTTGLEYGYTWFKVDTYDWDHDGADKPWAIVEEFDDPNNVYALTPETVREGWEKYIAMRLEQGWPITRAVEAMEDIDLPVADSILQLATWGEVRYG